MAIKQEVRERAIRMRQTGSTYKEIALELDVSVDWCKRNLNTIQREQHDWLQEAVQAALAPAGCTTRDLLYILHRNRQNIPVKEAKRLCVEQNIHCLFRPDWMDSKHPDASVELMYTMADEIHNAVVDRVSDILVQYPHLDRKRLQIDLLRLSGVQQDKNYREFENISLTLEEIHTRLEATE